MSGQLIINRSNKVCCSSESLSVARAVKMAACLGAIRSGIPGLAVCLPVGRQVATSFATITRLPLYPRVLIS